MLAKSKGNWSPRELRVLVVDSTGLVSKVNQGWQTNSRLIFSCFELGLIIELLCFLTCFYCTTYIQTVKIMQKVAIFYKIFHRSIDYFITVAWHRYTRFCVDHGKSSRTDIFLTGPNENSERDL